MKPFARGGRSAHGVAGKWWTLTALYPKRLRASVESYSIKQVEALYGFTRSRANPAKMWLAGLIALKTSWPSFEALEKGEALVAAGTPWLWAPSEMTDALDVLFIDEAGQMSLQMCLLSLRPPEAR
jgi:hypothetical protein